MQYYRRCDAKVVAGRVDGDADRVATASSPLVDPSVPVREESGDAVQVGGRRVRGESLGPNSIEKNVSLVSA